MSADITEKYLPFATSKPALIALNEPKFLDNSTTLEKKFFSGKIFLRIS